MTLKKIDSEFLEPVIRIKTKSMEIEPFEEVSRRLWFINPLEIEKEAYEKFIELPGEVNVPESTLVVRWSNVLTEIAAMRVNGNLVFPCTFSVSVEVSPRVFEERGGDLYITGDTEVGGLPCFLITVPKSRIDFENGTAQ